MEWKRKWRRVEGIKGFLVDYFSGKESFTIGDAESATLNIFRKEVKSPSIRARIYEGISDGNIERISRGVFRIIAEDGSNCLLIEGDGRDLSSLSDNSIDAIITDHPYDLKKQLKGGNRDFATYSLFQYRQEDFDQKFRVLKEGGFLVEFLPEESESNFEYLYQIKKYAISAGFKYYAKVPWTKGNFVANTGRKAKNTEDIFFFSKGEPRKLRLDAKKNLATLLANGIETKSKSSKEIEKLLEAHNLPVSFMKGARGMLPTEFNYQPESKKEKVMEAAKPIDLLEKLIEFVTLPGEKILDQFGGSGNIAIAALKLKRHCMVIENDPIIYQKMRDNVFEHLSIA